MLGRAVDLPLRNFCKARRHTATSRDRGAVQLYQITYLITGSEPDVRTVEATEVAAVIEHAGELGMQILVHPCPRPPGSRTRKEDAP
ncbi:hypothetical protein GCM10010425_84400 [Streptomyces spororaveus]|uniref:Uncharacterized protein n=1 Tax=Streptomyces spororaveus TaxID=284039 RepID=A0ABQ3T6K7_9ACTN|nr:hypothetical protein Sspor_15860 [Streptomyces spororaveus]